MNLINTIIILFSGVAFVIYGILLFTSTKMQNEFKRFELERFTKVTGFLELLGGIGLVLGLQHHFILIVSAGGFALLMLLGFGVRLKIKDGFWFSLPSLFFMLLNFYIFLTAM